MGGNPLECDYFFESLEMFEGLFYDIYLIGENASKKVLLRI
jgi:hypothetical protein